MPILQTFRTFLVLNLLTMLLQAAFAGRMIGGDARAFPMHAATAKVLVLLAGGLVLLATYMKFQSHCPAWVLIASGVLLAAEVIEFAAGHLHRVDLHVPLGVALFGGPLRLLIWSLQTRAATPAIQP